MKITISLSEAAELVRKAMNLPHAEIEIITREHPWAIHLRQVLRQFPSYEQKLEAIKAFRTLCGQVPDADGVNGMRSACGLADAKWAIENPSRALENLDKLGRVRA